MWQRFTERARRVILLAQEEAGKMDSGHVGVEHLLLGLLNEDEGAAAEILQKMGVALDETREKIRAQIVAAPEPSVEPKLTRAGKHVLELAADEARRMRHNYIGTEHLLLALLRESSDIAKVLGLHLEAARAATMEYLGTDASTREGASRGGETRALHQRVAALENEVRVLREIFEAASPRESTEKDAEIRALHDEIATLKFENRAIRQKVANLENENRAPDESA